MSKKRQIRISVSTAVKRDLKELEQSSLRSHTLTGYRSCNNRILKHFEDKLLKDITTADLHHFANNVLRNVTHSNGQRYAIKTIRETMARFANIIKKHRIRGEIRNDPFTDFELASGAKAKKTTPYTPVEIQALKDVADGSGIVEALDCMANTGLRGSELIALTHSNVDKRNATLRVEKSIVRNECNPPKTEYSERTVAVTDDSMNQISKQLKGASKVCNIILRQGADHPISLQDRFIFFNPKTGEGWKDIKELSKAILPFFKKAGVKFRGLSPLRHTFATEMRKSGFSYADIADILGHTSEVITKSIYVFQSEIVRGQQTVAERNEVPLY